jgi:hypothetical protein
MEVLSARLNKINPEISNLGAFTSVIAEDLKVLFSSD